MPSTNALIKAYGNILMPDRHDEMTFGEAYEKGIDSYTIRVTRVISPTEEVESLGGSEEIPF